MTSELKQQIRTFLKTKEPLQQREKFTLVKVLMPETLKQLEKTFLRESVKIKSINNSKRIVQNGATEDKFFNIEYKLILMRYLHHKAEIPMSG